MYILNPIVIEKPWGVEPHLIKYSTGINVESQNRVGELWIASGFKSLPDKTNRIKDDNNHRTIADIIENNPQFLGENLPLLRKPAGKTEAWYVREIKGEVRTITGLKKGIDKNKFQNLIKQGFFEEKHTFEELEQEIFTTTKFVRSGFYIIPAGTVHAIYAPDKDSYIIVDEIQQGFGDNALPILSKILFVTNSALSIQVHPSDDDVEKENQREILDKYMTEPTLRIYDFGRGRRCHPELASSIIKYGDSGFFRTRPVTVEVDSDCKITYLGATKFFARELIELHGGAKCKVQDIGNRYSILHCIDGEGILHWESGEIKLTRGITIAVPATIQNLSATTKHGLVFYRDYLPELSLLKRTMKNFGVSEDAISGVVVPVD